MTDSCQHYYIFPRPQHKQKTIIGICKLCGAPQEALAYYDNDSEALAARVRHTIMTFPLELTRPVISRKRIKGAGKWE